jgi:competence protein ComEA
MKVFFRRVKYSVIASLCLLPLIGPAALGGEPVNLNAASADELATLDNIGPVKAEAIVEYREANGAFGSIQALTQVSGIGERTVEMNLDSIVVE